ncbi:MAG: TIM barrel protein [Planctomycetales bacterium]|nr:TIM barrel protein [Planctomycetales bacterium]
MALAAGQAHAQTQAKPASGAKLARRVGITLSSFGQHLTKQPLRSEAGKISMLELPKLLREELDMDVIDLNTRGLGEMKPNELEQIRKAAEDAGVVLTNLKLNQPRLDMNSADKQVRQAAMSEYRRSIDAAAQLGLRWARPLPRTMRPDMDLHVAAYRELADYGAERGIQMLVENYGWMQSDLQSVVDLVRRIGHNVAACPDTGNWNSDEIRFAGLKATFPLAVSCDFKAKTFDANQEHPAYDLQRCFRIGWDAGFRGPWCLEHAHRDRATLFRNLAWLRDRLRSWMAS